MSSSEVKYPASAFDVVSLERWMREQFLKYDLIPTYFQSELLLAEVL